MLSSRQVIHVFTLTSNPLCIISILNVSDILSTGDLNSADQNLQFTVGHAPTRGHLENTDMPGVPITSFSQLDLAGISSFNLCNSVRANV